MADETLEAAGFGFILIPRVNGRAGDTAAVSVNSVQRNAAASMGEGVLVDPRRADVERADGRSHRWFLRKCSREGGRPAAKTRTLRHRSDSGDGHWRNLLTMEWRAATDNELRHFSVTRTVTWRMNGSGFVSVCWKRSARMKVFIGLAILFAMLPYSLSAQVRKRDFGTIPLAAGSIELTVLKAPDDSAIVRVVASDAAGIQSVTCHVRPVYLRSFLGKAERLRADATKRAPGETIELPDEILLCGDSYAPNSRLIASTSGAFMYFKREIGGNPEWMIIAYRSDKIRSAALGATQAKAAVLFKAMNEAAWNALQMK